MWIITNNAFVSIVEHRDYPGTLIVRGRFRGDVERFLNPMPSGESVIEECTPGADYRFRSAVPREAVLHALLRAGRRIDYPNFKDSIRAKWRKALAMRVWSIFHSEQEDRAAPARRANGASSASLW